MKKFFLLLFCLAAVSLSACKKHAPVASGETCYYGYLSFHPYLERFFEANPDAYNSFKRSCDLVALRNPTKFSVEYHLEQQKEHSYISAHYDRAEKILKSLKAKARKLATLETCGNGADRYIKKHPELLKDLVPTNTSDSYILGVVKPYFSPEVIFKQACYFVLLKMVKKLQEQASAIATAETCSPNYVQAHPNFLKNNLPLYKSFPDVIKEKNANFAFRKACAELYNSKKRKVELKKLQEQASAIATAETCSPNYVQAHPNFLKNNLDIISNAIDASDVSRAFKRACALNFVQVEMNKFATIETCRPDFFSDPIGSPSTLDSSAPLSIVKLVSLKFHGVINVEDILNARSQACRNFLSDNDQKFMAEASAVLTKKMCNTDSASELIRIIKAHPILLRETLAFEKAYDKAVDEANSGDEYDLRNFQGPPQGSYTYFMKACRSKGAGDSGIFGDFVENPYLYVGMKYKEYSIEGWLGWAGSYTGG